MSLLCLCTPFFLFNVNDLLADGMLIVELTVLNEVTITATDGVSEATLSGSDTDGVYLEDMFGTTVIARLDDTLVSGV